MRWAYGLGLGCAIPAPNNGFLELRRIGWEFDEFVDHEALNARVSETQNQTSLAHVDARDAFSARSRVVAHTRGAVWIEDRIETSYVVTEALSCDH